MFLCRISFRKLKNCIMLFILHIHVCLRAVSKSYMPVTVSSTLRPYHHKKWTKLRLSKKYDKNPSTCVKLCILAALYASVENTRSLERTGHTRAFLMACLNLRHYRPATFWSIFHKDFFLPESSAILLRVSLDFKPPWYLSSQEIQNNLPKVVCL